MAIDTSRAWWIGDSGEDIPAYLRAFSADQYPVRRTGLAACRGCGSDRFAVRIDDEEGCAERSCASCGQTVLMFDSADYVEDASFADAACPCGGETFNVAGGFALRDDGEVHWVYVGLRCTRDGVLGCYADWKIEYSPTSHLFDRV